MCDPHYFICSIDLAYALLIINSDNLFVRFIPEFKTGVRPTFKVFTRAQRAYVRFEMFWTEVISLQASKKTLRTTL